MSLNKNIKIDGQKIQTIPDPVNPYEKRLYRHYVLGLLTIVYAFNFIDRQLLVILQESIKNDLMLSDTQLGLLTGFAFALFYVLAGIPIASWADRSNRRNIISLAVGIWSSMTAISGLSVNYIQLLLARIGVGVGEAGGTPPAHSMISDIYPPEKRGTAMALYSVGINIGIMFGFFLGGILNEYFGWRIAFIVVGLPGILMALLFRFSVVEPTRGWSEKKKVSRVAIPLRSVLRHLMARKSFRHLCMACGLTAFVAYGTISWQAPFYIRLHGLGTAELGLWLATSIGLFGAIGTFMGGYWCDKLGVKDKRWYLWIPAIAILISFPCQLYILTTASTYTALIVNLLIGLLMTCYIGPSVAILHDMVDQRMRAMASAILYLVLNIIGLGCGPTIIGVLSDTLGGAYGNESLRYAMLFVIPAGCIWSATHFFLAAKTIREDLTSVDR